MKGFVSGCDVIEDFPLDEMPRFSVGVLTKVPDGNSEYPGGVVIRIDDEIDFLGETGGWTVADDDNDGYRYRPLRPGESVTITNDD